MTTPTLSADRWDQIMASLDALIAKFDDTTHHSPQEANHV